MLVYPYHKHLNDFLEFHCPLPIGFFSYASFSFSFINIYWGDKLCLFALFFFNVALEDTIFNFSQST